MKPIIILGTGGNCIDILDTLNEINKAARKTAYVCAGFLDDKRKNWGEDLHGIRVLGPLKSATEYPDCFFINGIGNAYNFWKKKDIIGHTDVPLDRFETIVHPTASVSAFSQLGYGTVIFQHVTINSNVEIGNHVVVLPNSVISHDDKLGDYTCVTGAVCISGETEVGESCYLGAGSRLMNNIKIGDRCLVGLGSVVLRDAPPNSVLIGNPARFLRPTVQ